MAKKTTTKTQKAPKNTKPTTQVKKDANGRFWLVPKHGGTEQGPFKTEQEALDAQAGSPEAAEIKPKKTKDPNEKKLSAIDAAAQVLAARKEPMNAKEMIDAMRGPR